MYLICRSFKIVFACQSLEFERVSLSICQRVWWIAPSHIINQGNLVRILFRRWDIWKRYGPFVKITNDERDNVRSMKKFHQGKFCYLISSSRIIKLNSSGKSACSFLILKSLSKSEGNLIKFLLLSIRFHVFIGS